MVETRYYDNSRISDFRTCERYYFFRHVCHLEALKPNYATAFGSSWHSAMNRIWGWACGQEDKVSPYEIVDLALHDDFMTTWREETGEEGTAIDCSANPDNWRTPMVAKEMLLNYIEVREVYFSAFELIATERPFVVPLDPNDPTRAYCGLRDKTTRHRKTNKISYQEHKTTSEYAKTGGFKNSFLAKFSPDSQCDGYYFAGKVEHGSLFEGVYVDGALVHKTVHDKFKIIPINRGLGTIDQWLWETHYRIDSIEANLEALEEVQEDDVYMGAFPRNTGSCQQYGQCKYHSICDGCMNPKKYLSQTPPGFARKIWDPVEKAKLHNLKDEDVLNVRGK